MRAALEIKRMEWRASKMRKMGVVFCTNNITRFVVPWPQEEKEGIREAVTPKVREMDFCRILRVLLIVGAWVLVLCVWGAKYLNSKIYGAAFCLEQFCLNGCSRRSRNPWFPYPLTVWLLKWFCLVLNDWKSDLCQPLQPVLVTFGKVLFGLNKFLE